MSIQKVRDVLSAAAATDQKIIVRKITDIEQAESALLSDVMQGRLKEGDLLVQQTEDSGGISATFWLASENDYGQPIIHSNVFFAAQTNISNDTDEYSASSLAAINGVGLHRS